LAVADWDYFLPKDHVDCPVKGKRYRIFEKQWKQVILLWLGREDVGDEQKQRFDEAKERFIRALVEFKDGCGEWGFARIDKGFYEYKAYFWAVSAINEFKNSALSTQIARQILTWQFNYPSRDGQQTLNLFAPIEDLVQKAMFSMNRKLVITEIMTIFKHCSDGSILSNLIPILHEIAQNDSNLIDELLQGFCTINNEVTRRFSGLALQRVAIGNLQAIHGLIEILATHKNEEILLNIPETLGGIGKANSEAINGLVSLLHTTDNEMNLKWTAWSLQKVGLGHSEAISGLSEILDTTQHKYTLKYSAESLYIIDPENPKLKSAFLRVIEAMADSEQNQIEAVLILNKVDPGNPECINTLEKIIKKPISEETRVIAAMELGKIDPKNPKAKNFCMGSPVEINMSSGTAISMSSQDLKDIKDFQNISSLINFVETTQNRIDLMWGVNQLEKILTARQKSEGILSAVEDYKKVVVTLQNFLSNEVYQNNFDRFYECYKAIWNCAQNLSYPDFYQAWHNPPTTPHPEIIDQTPHNSQTTLATPFTCESLKHLPIYCLNAKPLATETRESEIALKLCKLIWQPLQLKEIYPDVSTPGQLSRYLDTLHLNQQLPHRALLLINCETPTPELITFCEQLTDTLAIALLTHQPLEAPLKGFPPDQPNLLSAIQTWLEEI